MSIIFRAGIIALMISAVILARLNTKSGRSDMRGATRFAVVLGWMLLGCAIIGGHHVTDNAIEYNGLVLALMTATFQTIVLWMVYLALEPYGRRFWPDTLLGPMSGAGIDVLVGQGVLIGGVLNTLFRDVGAALLTTRVFVVCRLIARHQAPAIALGMAVLFYYWSSVEAADPLWLEIVLEIAAIAVITIATIRFGLLASAVTLFVAELLERAPMTFDVSHWSATASNWTIAIVIGLTLFALYAARSGQPLFGSDAAVAG